MIPEKEIYRLVKARPLNFVFCFGTMNPPEQRFNVFFDSIQE